MSAQPLIEMQGVSKIYSMGRVKVPALRDVSLTIQPGEWISIVGPSGSGKTTLLNLLACLDLPTSGRYLLQGQDVARLGDRNLSRLRGGGIGLVFQDFSLLSRFDAVRNIEMPHYYATGRGNRARALQLLERVGLAHRAGHRPAELSGGEQQRVAIARALMNDPFLLLADEPTGNLDTKSGREIIRLLEELNAQGLTVMIVTHDMTISARTRRVIRLTDGLVVSDSVQVPVLPAEEA